MIEAAAGSCRRGTPRQDRPQPAAPRLRLERRARLVEETLHLGADVLGQGAAPIARRLVAGRRLRRLDGRPDSDHDPPGSGDPGAGRHGLLRARESDRNDRRPGQRRQIRAPVVHVSDGGSRAPRALGEDEQDLAALQQLPCRLQRDAVELVALHREGADGGGEPAAHRSPEHGFLGERSQPPRAPSGDERHVEVRSMHRCEYGRSRSAEVLPAADADPEVAQSRQQPHVPAQPVDADGGPPVGCGEDVLVEAPGGGDRHVATSCDAPNRSQGRR